MTGDKDPRFRTPFGGGKETKFWGTVVQVVEGPVTFACPELGSEAGIEA